jgi:hypothetical protein
LSKKNKSKRFPQQSSDSIKKHDERMPRYRSMAEAEEKERKSDDVSELAQGGF